MNTEPTLYLVRIATEDGVQWDIYATDAPTTENATTEAKAELVDACGYDEDDVFELYPQYEVFGYKVTLTKSL